MNRDIIYQRLLNANKFKKDAQAQRDLAFKKMFLKAFFDISCWFAFMAFIALALIYATKFIN